MPEKQAQLEWEARAARMAAIMAWIAAALILATLVYRLTGLPRGATNTKDFLPQVEHHKNAFVVSGVLNALAILAYIPPLLYLFRVTQFRRPELPSVARILLIAGPLLYAVTSIWFQFRYGHAADQFVAGTNKSAKHADDVLRTSTTTVAALSLAASVAMGFATIMVSLNAMRAGLLSRFMGVLGIILGALFVLPLIASPIIQLFWLVALGFLYINRWPGGARGPAWDSGEALPWPSAQERAGTATPAAAADEAENGAEPSAAATTNPRASRKRKKRKARG